MHKVYSTIYGIQYLLKVHLLTKKKVFPGRAKTKKKKKERTVMKLKAFFFNTIYANRLLTMRVFMTLLSFF